jgi:GH24 family phage-related lysozyme (muramidase)
MNQILPEIVDFVASCERFVPVPYQDGPRQAQGYGHTEAAGEPKVGGEWTQAYAWRVLWSDLDRFGKEIAPHIKTSLTEMQFGACVSFAFNRGTTNFVKSEVLRLINDTTTKHHLIKAGIAFTDKVNCEAADKETGIRRVFVGLQARRIREAAMFLHQWPPKE